jgi:hypothetical protein
MNDFPAARNPLIRPLAVISGLFAVLGAPACGGAPYGETGAADGAGEAPAAVEENFFPTHELPWRGAPRNNVNIGMFQGGDAVIFAWDVGLKGECAPRGGACANVVAGLKVYWVTSTEPTTTRTTQLGQTSVNSWNRQICPTNTYASGYRINTGRSVVAPGQTRINQLGLICTELTRNVSSLLPLLGSAQGALFAERLSCSGSLSTDPRRYMGEIFMNKAGDGMNASCVRQ